MSNATSTKQLEMVPPCEIISVAMENKADNIPSELVHKNYSTQCTSLASMCFPHGDLKDDPWWRSTDSKLQIDSIDSNHALFTQDQAMLFFFKVPCADLRRAFLRWRAHFAQCRAGARSLAAPRRRAERAPRMGRLLRAARRRCFPFGASSDDWNKNNTEATYRD